MPTRRVLSSEEACEAVYVAVAESEATQRSQNHSRDVCLLAPVVTHDSSSMAVQGPIRLYLSTSSLPLI
jgi:hypothetical protein